MYRKHPISKNRMYTDTFFMPTSSLTAIKGNLDYAIKFIESEQLLNAPLWAKFAAQFRNTAIKVDDADNGWRGEYWGKMMRGACLTYQYTKNRELYEILRDTVYDMMANEDENGRISTYSIANQYNGWDMWCRKYVMLGMEYFIEICDDPTLISQITDSLRAQADYIISTVGNEKDGKVLITKTSGHWYGMNSSSILEPIVRLYNLTGEQKYLGFATYIVDCGGINYNDVSIFELAYENKLELSAYPVTKAYEMMSCFEGLLEYYRVTKIEKWKTAVINFADRVRLSEISLIGSAGCTHELFDNTKIRQSNTEYNGILQETCVTVTWMKFCLQLLTLTGNSLYADEIEKSLYNAYLGAINFNKNIENGGLPFDSYSPLLFTNRGRGVGGKKLFTDDTFYGCCACIGSAGTGLIGLEGVMLAKDGIVINTFANEKIKAYTPSGEELKITVSTEYPVDGVINFELDCDLANACKIYVRIPSWSQKSLATLNGEKIDVKNGEYAVFNKVWKKGDYITVKLDMRCKLIAALSDPTDKNAASHVAIKRGPLVLARDKRLPGDIESIVSFAPDSDGYINCELANSAISDYKYVYNIKDINNLDIQMIDYASAGRTWDDKSITTVWMPTENYWRLDLNKEISILAPNMWGMSEKKHPLAIGKDGLLAVTEDNGGEREKFLLWFTGENKCIIKVASSGQYLTVADDGVHITTSEKGSEFTIIKHAINRYRITASNGLGVCGAEDMINPQIYLGAATCEAWCVFVFEQ